MSRNFCLSMPSLFVSCIELFFRVTEEPRGSKQPVLLYLGAEKPASSESLHLPNPTKLNTEKKHKIGPRISCLIGLRKLPFFLLHIDCTKCLTKQLPNNSKGTLWAQAFVLDSDLPSPVGSKCWSRRAAGWCDRKPNRTRLHLESEPPRNTIIMLIMPRH